VDSTYAHLDLESAMEVVILDFETTGLSCERHRVIEIGAVILNEEGEILHTFQTLCNPPLVKPLPKIITKLTGITDSMLVGQQSTAMAMESLYVFIGNRPIIAHNATFDSKFLVAEMRRINKVIFNQFLCTLLLSRRLMQKAGCYKLSFLKKYINFQSAIDHKDHRALDDVLVTVALWKRLISLLSHLKGTVDEYAINLLATISRLSKKDVKCFLAEKKSGRSRLPKQTVAKEIIESISVVPSIETIQDFDIENIQPSVLAEDDEIETKDYPPVDMDIIALEFLVPEFITKIDPPAIAVLVHETYLIAPPKSVEQKIASPMSVELKIASPMSVKLKIASPIFVEQKIASPIFVEQKIASPIFVEQMCRPEKPMIRKVIRSSTTVAPAPPPKRRRSQRHSNPF
jgi:DNA polymerase III subunit epsilon